MIGVGMLKLTYDISPNRPVVLRLNTVDFI